jgi:tetratricopeptide (TPR) repeat protein
VLPEQDNLRAALDWAAGVGEIELGLRLAIALEQFWATVAPQEGARRVQALLDRAVSVSDVIRARALRVFGGVVFMTGEFERGDELVEQSLELFRSLGDEPAIAELLVRKAIYLHMCGDNDGARALIDESQAITRGVSSPSTQAMTLGLLGEIAWGEGRLDEALELAARSAEAAAEVDYAWWQLHQLYHSCEWSLELGRRAEAEAYGRDALRIASAIQDRQLIVYLLATLASTAAAEGQVSKAGLLWGAVEAEEGRGLVGQWEAERDVYAARVLERESEGFERGRVKGRHISLSDAVEHALQT